MGTEMNPKKVSWTFVPFILFVVMLTIANLSIMDRAFSVSEARGFAGLFVTFLQVISGIYFIGTLRASLTGGVYEHQFASNYLFFYWLKGFFLCCSILLNTAILTSGV